MAKKKERFLVMDNESGQSVPLSAFLISLENIVRNLPKESRCNPEFFKQACNYDFPDSKGDH